MKKNIRILSLLIVLLGFLGFFSLNATAQNVNVDEIIKKFVPAELTVMVDAHTGKNLSLEKGIRYKYVKPHFKTKGNYYVVYYTGGPIISEKSCYIKVIKDKGRGQYELLPDVALKPGINLGNCFDVQALDMDGDKSDEILVNTSVGMSGNTISIFKWGTDRLIDITPNTPNSDGSYSDVFLNPELSTATLNNLPYIIDAPTDDTSNGQIKLYQIVSGAFKVIGSYDFFQIIEKKPREPVAITTLNPAFASEGTYTLDIKNVSDHSRAVRAEVTVNGSVVLKPQDFCSAPAHGKHDKKWWFGNDDDDDRDDDHCKRCIPKNEAYAIVNMKIANEIKVKVYGRGNSKIQLTLVKK